MDSPPERVCPSCSAPAQSQQRWCLECGAELDRSRRRGIGPVIGIATTIAVLVGAASAGGYSLLQDGKQAPPPATTVAQEIPAPAPPTTETPTLPPATEEPAPLPPSDPLPFDPVEPDPSFDEPDLDTYSPPPPPPPPPSGGGGGGSSGDGGSGDKDPADTRAGRDQGERGGKTTRPRLRLTDIALGAAAVVYAPYTGADVDLGDPSFVNDGDPKTAWSTPAFSDPATHPQLGVYIDLGARERLRRLELKTPTPGMSVEIYGARKGPPHGITDPGWDHLANRRDVPATATFKLGNGAYRYLLVWVTGLPEGGDHAAISELSLLSMQPE